MRNSGNVPLEGKKVKGADGAHSGPPDGSTQDLGDFAPGGSPKPTYKAGKASTKGVGNDDAAKADEAIAELGLGKATDLSHLTAGPKKVGTMDAGAYKDPANMDQSY